MSVNELPIIGLRLTGVTVNDTRDEITFTFDDGRRFRMFHNQDCCESVGVEDVVGEWDDLLGAPLRMAEETMQADETGEYESATWTFYRFQADKGIVTVRWLGFSNGYYSESVDWSWVK